MPHGATVANICENPLNFFIFSHLLLSRFSPLPLQSLSALPAPRAAAAALPALRRAAVALLVLHIRVGRRAQGWGGAPPRPKGQGRIGQLDNIRDPSIWWAIH